MATKIVKAEDLRFGPGHSTPVISQSQKFILPVPPFGSAGEKLVYPPYHDHAGEPIIDWQGKPAGDTGIVFFNTKDQTWQAAPGDGNAVIIINEVTEEQATRIREKIHEFHPDPNSLSLEELKQVLAFVREELALGDMYNSTKQFVSAHMTPALENEQASIQNKALEGFGLMKREDKDICQAVYVPGPFMFQGPAAAPQVFKDGGVLILQEGCIRGVQPDVFRRTYRHADGRVIHSVSETWSS